MPTTAKTSSPKRRPPTRAKRNGAARASARQPSTNGSAPDAIELLLADHKKIRRLLSELKNAEKQAQRDKVLAQVQQELKSHTTIEEEIFYPAFRHAATTKKDEQLFFEAEAEHHAADLILREVSSATGDEFAGRAKVLAEIVEHHAEEEESDMFPRARKLLSNAELERLGGEMAVRKQSFGQSTLERVAALLPFSSR